VVVKIWSAKTQLPRAFFSLPIFLCLPQNLLALQGLTFKKIRLLIVTLFSCLAEKGLTSRISGCPQVFLRITALGGCSRISSFVSPRTTLNYLFPVVALPLSWDFLARFVR